MAYVHGEKTERVFHHALIRLQNKGFCSLFILSTPYPQYTDIRPTINTVDQGECSGGQPRLSTHTRSRQYYRLLLSHISQHSILMMLGEYDGTCNGKFRHIGLQHNMCALIRSKADLVDPFSPCKEMIWIVSRGWGFSLERIITYDDNTTQLTYSIKFPSSMRRTSLSCDGLCPKMKR